jgi:hypothetical protein
MLKGSIPSFLTQKRRWPWYRIDLLLNVTPTELDKARTAAKNHQGGVLSALRYTEHNPAWVLLYDDIKTSQIHPDDIRHMRCLDLEYLAGMNDSPPGLTVLESAKLRENVARATHELNRRNQLRSGLIGAIIGAIIGAVATLLSKAV